MTSDEADEIVASYINGQKKQMVKQLDKYGDHAEFIDYAADALGAEEVLKMLKSYFRIKAR